MTQITETQVTHKSSAAGMAAGADRSLSAAWQTMKVWYERSKQRRHLLELDDYLLRDIGLDRITAIREAAKPFWRD
jgi:uncharacterized protein YjiS (DUF1127 family)